MTTDIARQLDDIAEGLRFRGARVTRRGSGVGAFLVVDYGERAAELYFGTDSVFLDPACGDELLGEIRYDSAAAAMDAAWRWLNDGELP